MEDKIIALVTELTYLSMVVNLKTDKRFGVQIYQWKWLRIDIRMRAHFERDYKSDVEMEVSLWSKSDNEMKHAIEGLRSAIYQAKLILKKDKIDYEKLRQVERIEYDYKF